MPEQIVIKEAGLPGAPNSYYSEEKTLTTPGDDASPAVGAYTVIPEIGWILFEDLGATQSVVLKTDDSPETYATIIKAGSQGCVWSDGTNMFVLNAAAVASPELTAKYFVLAEKP
jgi:hypothetical protein